MAFFRYTDEAFYKPESGGVNWYDLRMSKLQQLGMNPVEVEFVNVDDDLIQQVTQENVIIHLNSMLPEVDRIQVQDDRELDDPDGAGSWVFYRDETPNFEPTLEVVTPYATVIETMYPMEHVLGHYLMRRSAEIEHIDEL